MVESDTNARRWLVSGRVQGVGFRWFVRQHAAELGLVGTVRNLADGRVEVVAGGATDSLTRLARLLASGPPGAAVQDVVGEPASLPAELRTFGVTH